MDELVMDEKGRIYKKKGEDYERLSIFTDHYYSLRAINGIPILEIDGVRMHLIKNFKTPKEYSKLVCKMLKIGKDSRVLDTCGGLGYTAIEASKKAKRVVSVEKSPEVIELAKQNPHSKEYFNKKKIKIINGDSFGVVKELKNNSFDRIIHDPPRKNFAPHLYSSEFYLEIFRILRPGGILYHYVGFLGRRKGQEIEKKTMRKLKEVGFEIIKYDEKGYGILAKRPKQQKRE